MSFRDIHGRNILLLLTGGAVLVVLIPLVLRVLGVVLEVSGWVLSLLNLIFSIVTLLVSIASPVLVLLCIWLAVVYLSRLVVDQAQQMKEVINNATDREPENLLPIAIAGLVEITILAISEEVANTSLKVVSSTYVWLVATALLMMAARKTRLAKIVVTSFVVVVTGVFAWGVLPVWHIQKLLERLRGLSTPDRLAVGLLAFLVVSTIVVGMFYVARSRANTS